MRGLDHNLYQIAYVWRLDNTLDTRIEYDGTSQQTATVGVEYDVRHPLRRETRTLAGEPPQTVYDIQYDYDQLGNRTVKIENTADRITYYEYDTDYDDPNDPNYPLYPTRNNRLLKYEVFEDEVRTRRVWYVYYDTGHVSNIIVKDEGEGDDYDWYRGLSFTYWGLGHSQVGLALWEKWPEEYGPFPGELTPEQGYDKLALREFRYHPNPRGRFMTRDLDPDDQAWEWSTVAAEHWTDYDIPMPYGDFDVTLDPNDAPVETEQMRYLEGFGLPAQQTASTGATQYLHGDLIRSTMLTTGQGGTAVSAVSYTAFGEVIGTPPGTRYQYAGGWGYESDLLILEGAPGTTPITLQHVGHRWYDPSLGRFIQRDPLGTFGGLNVYAYAGNRPTVAVDPSGLTYIIHPELGGTITRLGISIGIKQGTVILPPTPPWGAGMSLGAKAGLVGATFCVFYGVGTLINYGVGKATGRSLSDRLGDFLWRKFGNPPPGILVFPGGGMALPPAPLRPGQYPFPTP